MNKAVKHTKCAELNIFVPFYINYNKKGIISLLKEWDELIHFAFTKAFFEKEMQSSVILWHCLPQNNPCTFQANTYLNRAMSRALSSNRASVLEHVQQHHCSIMKTPALLTGLERVILLAQVFPSFLRDLQIHIHLKMTLAQHRARHLCDIFMSEIVFMSVQLIQRAAARVLTESR